VAFLDASEPTQPVLRAGHAIYFRKIVPRFEDLQYDPASPDVEIMPDGEHFVFLLDQSSSRPHFNVILNWFEELKARVPTK
jgi:hypothetical protein